MCGYVVAADFRSMIMKTSVVFLWKHRKSTYSESRSRLFFIGIAYYFQSMNRLQHFTKTDKGKYIAIESTHLPIFHVGRHLYMYLPTAFFQSNALLFHQFSPTKDRLQGIAFITIAFPNLIACRYGFSDFPDPVHVLTAPLHTGRLWRNSPSVHRWRAQTRDTWAEKFESFERINSIRVTNEKFDSRNSCKRLVPSRLHELQESKF